MPNFSPSPARHARIVFLVALLGLGACTGESLPRSDPLASRNPFLLLINQNVHRVVEDPPAIRGLGREDPAVALGVGWVRVTFWWRLHKKAGEAELEWPLDPLVDRLHAADVRIFGLISSFPGEPPNVWNDMEVFASRLTAAERAEYEHFLREFVRHYRGKIQVFQLDNEVYFRDKHVSPEEYADFFASAYAIIKQEDPAALVCTAGVGIARFAGPFHSRFAAEYLPAILALGVRPDAYDVHLHARDTLGAEAVFKRFGEAKALPGAERLTFFNSEGSTWSGRYRGGERSETEHAVEMLKRCYLGVAAGYRAGLGPEMDRTVWINRHGERNDFHVFSLNGLLHHPEKRYADGTRKDWAKLAFWSLKLLASLGDATSPEDYELLSLSPGGAVVIRVARPSGPLYIVFRDTAGADGPASEPLGYALALDDASALRARITRAVPRDPTGASIDLAGWRDRFETHTVPVEAARVNLSLHEIPVYVEPLGS